MIPPTSLPPVPTPATANPSAGPAPATVRIDAFQPGMPQRNSSGMGQAFNNAIDGFSARAQQMQASMRDVAASGAAQGMPALGASGLSPSGTSVTLSPPVQGPVTIGNLQPVSGSPAAQSPMALMVDSFNFAIEASLVSRAATQFTGAVSTLMKGQ